MFDVGFTELFLIGVIALIVIGPERLPGAARTTGAWLGKMKRTLNSVKSEVQRELDAEELRKSLGVDDNVKDFGQSLTQDILKPDTHKSDPPKS